MKNKSIKIKLKKKKKYFTPEIISAVIFRISSAILFLHTHNLIHRKVTIGNTFFDSYNRVHLGGYKLMLSQDINNEYSKEELSKNDQQNKKNFDIQSFGILLKKIYSYIPSCLKSEIDELANKCIDDEIIDAHDLFTTVLANNCYYKGNKLNEFNFLRKNIFIHHL